jgi:hypothetical protein
MQRDWLDVAYEVMNPNPRIFIHDRQDYTLKQIVKTGGPQESVSKKPWWKLW